jgi:hypothetical protein
MFGPARWIVRESVSLGMRPIGEQWFSARRSNVPQSPRSNGS